MERTQRFHSWIQWYFVSSNATVWILLCASSSILLKVTFSIKYLNNSKVRHKKTVWSICSEGSDSAEGFLLASLYVLFECWDYNTETRRCSGRGFPFTFLFQETKNLWKAKLEGSSQEESLSAKLGKGSASWLLRKFKNKTQRVGKEGM